MFSSSDTFISYLTMSHSDLFLVKEYNEEMEFNFSQRPGFQFQDGVISHQCHHQDQDKQQEQEREQEAAKVEITEKVKEECKRTASSAESTSPVTLGELKATNDDDDDEEDNDGFKTPTSLDHKIPVTKQCPPAPGKPKIPPSAKRKARHTNVRRRNLQLDLCQELESLFPRTILDDFYNKMKKARRDDR
eukprot:XP_002527720.2 cyclin-dependent protein kinase inhibitor SMR14 [Ricinus communis]